MDIRGNISYRIPEQRISPLSEGGKKTFFSFPVFELVSYYDGRNKPTILGKIARMRNECETVGWETLSVSQLRLGQKCSPELAFRITDLSIYSICLV